MGEAKEMIIKRINELSGKYAPYQIFYDFVEASAIAVANACTIRHDDVWKEREERYQRIINKYQPEEVERLAEMFGLLVQSLQDEIEDVLGEVFMRSGCGNKHTGQFFTPFHLAALTAELDLPDEISEEHPHHLYEPSCGGGGLIIGACKAIHNRGINYQKCLKVTAQDIDCLGVYMTYLQLSLLGVDAVVAQGDTLCEPYSPGKPYKKSRVWRSPKNTGALI